MSETQFYDDLIRRFDYSSPIKNVICAFRAGKQIVQKIIIRTSIENKSRIEGILMDYEKKVLGDSVLFEIISGEERKNKFLDFFEHEF